MNRKNEWLKPELAEIRGAVEQLQTLALRYERGQCIPWAEIESIAGQRHENRSRHIIKKWRKLLQQDRQIITFVAPQIGVRLLTHQEAAHEVPLYSTKRARRELNRSLKRMHCIDHDRLTLTERKMLASQQQHIQSQRRSLSRSQRELREVIQPTETLPLRKPVTT